MSDRPTIGFIGVGLMGHGMASNILKAGYPLVVMGHRNRAPVDDLVGNGAEEADTPEAMAERASIIHLCVTGSPQVEEIVFGPNGLLEAVGPDHTIIDTSTSAPPSTKRIAAALDARGCRFADAPLSRTPKEAAEGTLDTMVGASDETFAIIEPVLQTWAGVIVRTGEVGTGHTMKLLNNFVAMGYGALYAEALALGAKAGVTPQTFHEVIGAGRMRNGFYDTFMRYVVERDPNAHAFAIQNAAKDMRYLAQLANEVGAVNPVGAAVRNTYTAATAQGRGADYLPTISDFIAEQNGTSHGEVARPKGKA